MMRTIFEAETAIGKCECEDGFSFAEPEYANVVAHTSAVLNGRKGMLKLEHHCYLRHGRELPDQPWVRPEITFEAAFDAEPKLLELARERHEDFVRRVRAKFPQEYLVNTP